MFSKDVQFDHGLDQTDRKILRALQKDSSLSQRDIAEEVGLSQSACWRRLKAMRDAGVIGGQTIRLDPKLVGLGLTVFMMVRTKQHSSEWLMRFRRTISNIPNVIDFYRIAGDYDYMFKIMAEDMNDFDRVYQQIIDKVELDTVTSYITMEAIVDQRNLPI